MEQEETRRKPTVRGIWEEILRLVYPPKCVFCGALLERAEQDACKPCLAELPWTDTHSAVQTGRAFSQCVSPFFLTGKVHQALVDYKYHQRESYGVCFGRWMGDCACRCLSDAFDLVTWCASEPETAAGAWIRPVPAVGNAGGQGLWKASSAYPEEVEGHSRSGLWGRRQSGATEAGERSVSRSLHRQDRRKAHLAGRRHHHHGQHLGRSGTHAVGSGSGGGVLCDSGSNAGSPG